MLGLGSRGDRYVVLKAAVFVVLAVLGGAGTVYAPVLTFTAVAATLVLSLRWFGKDARRTPAGRDDSHDGEVQSKPQSTLTTKLVSAFLLGWWLILVFPIATYSPRGAGNAAVGAAQGSLQNQIMIISFGLVGALFLPAAIRRFSPTFWGVAALWTLYLCWAFASLLWSVYPPLTFRNVVALVLMTVGSFGLGAGFYGGLPNGRELFVRHILVAAFLSALMVLVPLPFRWSQYDLLDPAQRLAIGGGFTSLVVRPIACALMVLAVTTVLGVREWRRRDWFLVVIFVLPLLALKSRGPILWGIVALAIFYLFYKTRIHDRVMQAGLLFVIGLGTYLYYSEGLFTSVIPYLIRGSARVAGTLTGRVPLWELLLPEIEKHPWLGAGFAAFWSPDKLRQMELLASEGALSAHNGYLEEVLNTGIVGLALLLAFCLYTMAVVLRQARLGDPFGWLAFVLLAFYLLLNLTNALVQEALQFPFFITLAILGLMAGKRTSGPPPPRSATGEIRSRVASPR